MNILNEIQFQKEKNNELHQSHLLREAYSILQGSNAKEDDYYPIYLNNHNISTASTLSKTLDLNRIFSIEDIRFVCIKYNLRFLESKFHKAELPYDVKIKCSAFEIETNKPIVFKIVSDASSFKTKFPKMQHALFADIGDGEYYFINQWGNEYSNYKKWFALPYRNVEILFGVILVISAILTIITPTNFITTKPNIDYFSMIRMAYFFWCIVFLSAIFTYYIVSLRKGLNDTKWDNPSFL